jgi:hypothetical protein
MKLEKLLDKLSSEVVTEIDAQDVETLNKTVAESTENINKAVLELKQNPEYQKAKEVVKDFNGGLRDAKYYQLAKITLALLRIKELNGDEIDEATMNTLHEIRNRPKA